ncbi:hypothetical protein JXB31_00340 [Candidatus Woesearchaeota archaeon]|nr:hypothetical protein [Candidatus Woesearchaeota archaeon]
MDKVNKLEKKGILDSYVPKRFGKEYYEINGSRQYSMFLSVALGVKKSFDDWVQPDRLDEFRRVCRDYGLYLETDVIFDKAQLDKGTVIGGENITTTFVVAEQFMDKTGPKSRAGKSDRYKSKSSQKLHVFVSGSKKTAIEAKKFGWYSVIINNRNINKPFVDHLRFGGCLGYPACCIDFFRRFNNWSLYNHPYEVYKNTPNLPGMAKGSYLCNNHLMDNSYFFIHHLPCSYRCENTISYARMVEDRIMDVEPGYARKTAGFLKQPLLVFGEKNFIIFDGRLKQGEIRYTNAQYLSNAARPEESISFFEDVLKGNRITFASGSAAISGVGSRGPAKSVDSAGSICSADTGHFGHTGTGSSGCLDIMHNNKLVSRVKKRKDWFIIDFD